MPGTLDSLLPPTDTFARRHIGPSEADIAAMLGELGYNSLDALIDATVPPAIRAAGPLAIPAARGDWALGFMLPSKGSASCGRYFSANSFGHTGFTGTSLWYDPRRDRMVVILANRVHPTRENTKFVKLRPLLHNAAVECL